MLLKSLWDSLHNSVRELSTWIYTFLGGSAATAKVLSDEKAERIREGAQATMDWSTEYFLHVGLTALMTLMVMFWGTIFFKMAQARINKVFSKRKQQ